MEAIIGSHVSFNNKNQLVGSVKEAISYNANTFMFYTGSTQSTLRSEINDELTYEAYKLMVENGINSSNVIVHAPYIINLANRINDDKFMFYVDFLTEELNRVKRLGFDKIVLHPGSAVNCSREEGIKNIIDGLNIAISKTSDVTILLETMAGKGNELGINIDELKSIIVGINDKNRIGVCLDTCHLNDSGIDINKFDEYLDEFDKIIGLNYVKCVHLNDSMNPIGSHKDRHHNIGYGTIGFNPLCNVLYNPRLEGLPFILETPYVNRNTPNEYPPYKYEIDNLRKKEFIDFIQ
ncbi:MAG: deoxyribonuclease IV [Bacilli bacterium]|nr:deoxyribonuclease IV [Bacilli bacterium]